MRNAFGIQAYGSVICGYFCIWFIDFLIIDKCLLDFTSLFFPNEYENNDKIVLKNFQENETRMDGEKKLFLVIKFKDKTNKNILRWM